MLRSLLSLRSLRRAPATLRFLTTTGETQCRDEAVKQEGERRLVPMPKRTGVSALVPRAFFSTQTTTSESERVVSVGWLNANLKGPGLKVLDASWYMPDEQRSQLQEYQDAHIPGALFFDIDGISDRATKLPHMLPSEEAFAAAVSALGIENEDAVVVYEGKGFYSAARVVWMFRVFGHDRVWVLDGGLPRWRASGYAVESSALGDGILKVVAASEAIEKVYKGEPVGPTTFQTKFQPHLIYNLEQVIYEIEERTRQHIDAPSKARFDGTAFEPQKGIRSGHVHGSKCIPIPEGGRSHFLLSYAKFWVDGTYVAANAAFVLNSKDPLTLHCAETFENPFKSAVSTLTHKSELVFTTDNTELATRILQDEVNKSLKIFGVECTKLIVEIKPVNAKCGGDQMTEDGFLSMVESKVREKASDEVATKVVAMFIWFWENFK